MGYYLKNINRIPAVAATCDDNGSFCWRSTLLLERNPDSMFSEFIGKEEEVADYQSEGIPW